MESGELEGLEAFVAVVETGAFAAAARRLRVTTSAVSKKVNKLERQLGAKLLLRTTRKLSMTEAGETFFVHARRALGEAAAGREAVAGLRAAPRGLLRLAAPMTFGTLHVAPAIVPFMATCPEVRIDLVLDDRLQDLAA